MYAISETDPTGSLENLAATLVGDDRDLVRALAISGMLGGTYAEDVCRTAGIDKAIPALKADPRLLFTALTTLFDNVKHHVHPILSATSCEPVILNPESASLSNETNRFSGFSEALEAFYPMTKAEKVRVASKPKFSDEEKIRKYQESAIKKFDEKIKKTEEIVAAIYENYQFVVHLISSLDTASKRLSWQEIEHHLCDTSSADAKRIVTFSPDELR